MTRRDFLNGLLLGTGAVLLDLPSPRELFAAGGTPSGDDSFGNPEEVIRVCHGLRDGLYRDLQEAVDTGETYDLVVVGGGLSGLGAAHFFGKAAGGRGACLILENHPAVGGHAKRNEFLVNGYRLTGPQASNSFVVIDRPGSTGNELFEDLRVPRTFRYQTYRSPEGGLAFDRTNYAHMLWYDGSPSYGYSFGTGGWVRNLWKDGMANSPYTEKVRRDFQVWRFGKTRYHADEDFGEWLDTMTYKQYLESVMGLSPEITAFVNPVLAATVGLGADAVSAFGAYQVAMPGFQTFPGGFARSSMFEENKWHSFPGGNEGFVRHFLKRLLPEAIGGADNFTDIMTGLIRPGAFDLPGNSVRIRLNSLCVAVEHEGAPERSEHVRVTYLKNGVLRRVRAGGVVMASGGLSTRRIVRDMPDAWRRAYESFLYAPIMVANVAVRNWRFLHRLGLTACRWFEGFGFSCNIRRSMVVGDETPELNPDSPAVITFYIPFHRPGLDAREQVTRGRTEMLGTTYAEYERRLLAQMQTLFADAGFEPERDVAGIALNRWGHAFVVPQPGYYSGSGTVPASVLRQRFGRVAFAHAELNGHQHWLGAVEEGQRAAKQLLAVMA